MTRNLRLITVVPHAFRGNVTQALIACAVLGGVVTLSGCTLPQQTSEAAATATSEPRLSLDTWPTPVPTVAPVTPTPFPRATWAPSPTHTAPAQGAGTPLPDEVPPAVEGAAPATPAIPPTAASAPTAQQGAGERLVFTGNPQALVEQVMALSGGFTPAGAAMVTRDAAVVRQGPGETYAVVGPARRGEMVAVLGQNGAGDWIYVLTQSVVQGWMPASALQQTFRLTEPPVLADNPEPPATAAVGGGLTELLTELAPVASGLVTAEGVSARQGPGNDYPAIAGVGQGELLGVFGTNAGGDWLYIVTISGTLGWVPRDAVRVMGALDGAPVLPADPLAALAPAPAAAAVAPTPAAAEPVDAAAGLSIVAAATVNADQLNVRQGAGPDYPVVTTVRRGDTLSVMAVNKARDWALIVTADGQSGWVYAEYLAVSGSLAEAPVVPATALAAAPPAGATALPAAPTATATVAPSRPTATPSPLAVALAGLAPLATAEPAGDEAILYRGPATTYEPIVALQRGDRAAVLATARGASGWLLLQPARSGAAPGWAQAGDLSITGSINGAPQVTTAWVKSNEVPTRSGPGIAYDRNGAFAINTLVSVAGVDRSRGWALVVPLRGGGAGWVPLNFLALSGNWADLPELPADALALAASAPAPTAAVVSAEPTTPVVAAEPAAPVPPGEAAALSAPTPVAPRAASVADRLAIQLSSGGDIVIVNSDGSSLRRLTAGIDPALSYDGSQVAFTRWNGEDGSVWVINVDGSGERHVLGETKQAKHPAWSPEGSRLVINFQRGGRLQEKYQCKNLIELGDNRPNIPWNVDMDSVKVEVHRGLPYLCWTLPPDPHWGLRVISLADGSYQDMPSDTYAFAPEWDPTNNWRIVSSGVNGLVQLDANRQAQWELTDRFGDRTPAFSPDGQFIAVAHNQNGSYDIHRLNADGNGRVRLTQTPIWVTAAPGGAKPWNNVAPVWSPDGSHIAFLTDRTGRWEIWVMNADGSNPRPMFSDAVNDQLPIRYDFVDERVFSWR